MRAPNSIDFWRGFALVEIMINHIPDNGFWRVTHRQFSWSDSAELLMFIAGCTTAICYAHRPARVVWPAVVERLRKIYLGHLAFSLMLVGLYVYAHDVLKDAAILSDNHVALARSDWSCFLAGLFTLTLHVRFFDILSVYFVLTLWTPLMLALDRMSRPLLLAVSLTAYAVALATRVNIPLWTGDGHWAFNPFAWQLAFTLGYLLASRPAQLAEALGRLRFVTPLAWIVLAVSFGCMLAGLPHPELEQRGALEDFLWSKTHLGPLRILQFLALAHAARSLTWLVPRYLPYVWRLLSLVGRDSLAVFCSGAVLSAVGQIAHRAGWHGVAFDTAYTAGAIATMAMAAYLHRAMKASLRKREAGRISPGAVAPRPVG